MAEIDDYQTLGLGRGVNVTDAHMWRNKSSFVVRTISDSNIIRTEESGMFEKYEKVVSTISREQRKIRLLLDDPSSQIKIGMDAQQTQSLTSSMRIAGTKIKTRTISFCTNFGDLPPYVQTDKPQYTTYRSNEEDDCFERSFCLWILDRIRSRESTEDSDKKANVSDMKTEQAVKEIFEHLSSPCNTEKRKEISNDCEVFVRDLGITHYVNSIELGAMKYNAATISSKQRKLGGGAEVGAGKYAEGGLSGFTEKLWFQSQKEERSIGKINDDGTVTRSKENEAVIGFQIQPIYSLAPIPYLQPALQNAVKEYIQLKSDPTGEITFVHCSLRFYSLHQSIQFICQHNFTSSTEGPFLISCFMPEEDDTAHAPAEKNETNTVDDSEDDDSETEQGGKKSERYDTLKETDEFRKENVYWCVSKKDNSVYGTTSPEEASLFHIIPTGDSKYPSEFFIVHWQGNRSRLTNVTDPLVRSRAKMTNLPLYLTTNTGIFGQSEGPLQLKSTVLTNQARFCLHSRVQSTFACMMCLSTPVSLSDWIEGEQFYINCSRRAFKIDGYIAMMKLASEGEVQKTYQYKTVTLPSISDPSSSAKGMLFRLHPPLARSGSTQTESSETINPNRYTVPVQVPQEETRSTPDPRAAEIARQLCAIGDQIDKDCRSTMAGQYRMLFGHDQEGSSV